MMPDTFGSQVPGSSPIGSVIEITDTADEISQQSEQHHHYHGKSGNIVSLGSDDALSNSSALIELTRHEYHASQQMTSPADTQYLDLKSAQTPPRSSSPRTTHDVPPVMSSSPVAEPMSPQLRNSMASAQLTSFRMVSPVKINSSVTTPKKRNILITQESFSIPNLISPTRQLDILNSASSNSSSLYATARQPWSPGDTNNITTTTTTTTTVTFQGKLNPSSSPHREYSTRVVPQKRVFEEIPDTSDDEDVSIIEITRTTTKKNRQSVLQVPSSQQFSSPLTSNTLHSPSPLHSTRPSIKSPSSRQVTRRPSPLKSIQSSPLGNNFEQTGDTQDELSELSMDQLRQKIMRYGLKPSKSRLGMIQSIRQVSQYLSQGSLLQLSQSENITQSQGIVRKDVFQVINDIVKSNDLIWERIYTFQPIRQSQLQTLLNEHEVVVSNDLFKEWCDHNSISIMEEEREREI